MKNKRRHIGAVFGAGLLAAGQAWADSTADDLMKKSVAAMKSAKTYQAVLELRVDGGPRGAMAMEINVKTLSGKKIAVDSKPIGNPTGMMASMGPIFNMQLVDDGKTAWTYFRGTKQYTRQLSQGIAANPFDFQKLATTSSNATYKLIGNEFVGGKPTFVIQLIPRQSITGDGGEKILFFVDKATYRFRRIKLFSAGPNVPNQPPQKMDMSVAVKSERVNESIPDSVFTFTPPTGAKEVQGGVGRVPGGSAGMFGSGGTRRR